MRGVLGLKCVLCGAEYSLRDGSQAFRYVCDHHGDAGILDVIYDYPSIHRTLTADALRLNPDRSIWRYLPLLPFDPQLVARLRGDCDAHPLFCVGWTSLYRARRLEAVLDLAEVYVKDDGRNPSASFKDRASAVGIVKALEWGASTIAAASTGNAASSLATLSASVGIKNIIFVPESAPQAKIAQLLIHGATVLPVQGAYDQAFDLCLEACRAFGWYSRNTGYNPYLSEGKKTAALEICEQLGWRAPDCILVSVGDGCIIGGLGKGLRDLRALDLIDRLPRLIGVQAAGSAALYDAWQRGSEQIDPVRAHTLADSISVDMPRDGVKALRAVRETGGAFVTVSDEEILAAMRVLAREAGVFGEPAGAASYAGLVKARETGLVRVGERVVVLVTGSGLKDVPGAMKAVQAPMPVAPTLEAVVQRLQGGTESACLPS
ncbi:MAG: threonine synthase [Anaerolineae bacterium]|nr:threonine synthase [Anaerolineae bacterium]